MKLINKAIYALSVAGMMGLWSCSSEEAMPDVNVASGERVPITIVVSREGDSGTRTELSENLQNGGLTHTWSAGDELYLYDSNGAEAGKVTLESGDGSAKGVFKGEVTATSGEYCLWYFGSKQPAASDADLAGYPYVSVSGGQVTLDLKAPKFETAADFSKVDVMSQKATINVNGNQATVAQTVTMQPHVALARFDLRNLPAGVTGTLKVYDTKAQTEGNINTKQVLSLSDGSVVRSEETEAYTFTDWSSDKDLYVAFVPYSSNLKFEYTYQKEVQEVVNGATVKNTYPIKNIHSFKENQNLVAGIYYQSVKTVEGSQAPTIGGVEVPFEIDDSDNPGNTGNWSGEDTEIVYDGVLKRVSDADGWTTNIVSVPDYGGWCTLYTYKQNAIIDGLLSSTNNGGAFYYQWGRWLGFPLECKNTYFQNEEAKGSYPTSAQHLPGNPHLNLNVGYTGNGRLMATYISGYMGANSSFTREKAKNWSTMFAMITRAFVGNWDYVYNNEVCKWEDRSGNPCPDGYRLPTSEDFNALIPTSQTISSGVTKEFKIVKGVRYAFQWTTGVDDTKYVEIKSVKSNESNINNVDFTAIPAIRLTAYGYLNSGNRPVTRDNLGVLGLYWTNESGTNTLNGTQGNGAKYLSVIFGNGEVNFSIRVAPRTFGGCVIPIKDAKAKSASVTPWLPYSASN